MVRQAAVRPADASPVWNTPVAVPDRNYLSVRSEDGVGAAQALGFPGGGGVLAGKPCAGFLVEEEDLAALVVMDRAAVVEERFQRREPDAALLHARGSVLGEAQLVDGSHALPRQSSRHSYGVRWLRG